MANENLTNVQPQFADKVAAGTEAVGTAIGDAVQDRLDKMDELGATVNSLPPELRGWALENPQNMKEALSGQGVTQSQYSQIPAPEMIGDKNINTLESLIKNPTQPVQTGMVNAAAAENGAPLTPAQAGAVAGENPVPAEALGTGAAMAAAPEPVQAPVSQQQIASIAGQAQSPFAKSDAQALDAINLGEKAGLALAQAKETFATEKMRIEAEQQKKNEDLKAAFDVQYQEKMDDLNANVKELRAMAGEKLIPGAMLARQDTQASIMTGLAVALGGFAQAYTGSNQNLGLEMINKAIDRDIEAQRFNLERKRLIKGEEINVNKSLLNQMREKFGDDRSAVLAAKASMLAIAEDEMNRKLNSKGGYANLSTNAQAQAARSQLSKQRELYEMQLRAAQEQKYSLDEMLKGADKYNLTTEQAQALYGEKGAEKYVQGFGPALSKEDKKAFQDTYGDSKNSLMALDKLISTDINKLDPVKRAEVASELNLLTGKMRLSVLGPGAMTEKEFDRLIETLGDPNALVALPGTQMKKLQTVRNRLQQQQDTLVKQYFGNKTFEELQSQKGKINFK